MVVDSEIRVTRSGKIVIRSSSRQERAKLDRAPFLSRVRSDVFVSHWVYLPDVLRLVPKAHLAGDARDVLSELVEGVKALRRGDDSEVFDVFGKRKPYGFQLEGIHAILNSGSLLLADDTGLGKTVMTLGALFVLFERSKCRRAVIVTRAALRRQWRREAWDFVGDGEARQAVEDSWIYYGSPSKRKKILSGDWRILFVNYELVLRDAKRIAAFSREIDFVALDEASSIKNPEAKTSLAIHALFSKASHRVALTATPIENKLADLWAILRFVDSSIFPTREYFDSRFIKWSKKKVRVYTRRGGSFIKTIFKPRKYVNLKDARRKIAGVYLRRTYDDVEAELPDLVVSWNPLEFKTGSAQEKLYRSIAKATSSAIAGESVAAALDKLVRLQLACNSTDLAGFKKRYSLKSDRIRELLEDELSGESVLIFTQFAKFATVLREELREWKPAMFIGVQHMKDRERQVSVDRFQSGETKVLIATGAGEYGLNLQRASILINADVPFNPARLKQRIGRARRIGSKVAKVRVINLIILGTIEETLILQTIYRKRDLFERLFDSDVLTQADPLDQLTVEQIRASLAE